jgi:hypothetical protein
MAYNVLKGIVEGSVDQHADQEIEGIKVFKSTISASVFYDTDAQSPCATVKDVALTKINGATKNSVLVYNGAGEATVNYNLTFSDDTLAAKKIWATNIAGCGEGITNIQPKNISGKIPATSIAHAAGLRDIRGKLQVHAGPGLTLNDDGLNVSYAPESALGFVGGKLTIDPTKAQNIQNGGQNISDADLLLIADISTGNVKNTSAANLYNGYLKSKIPQASGPLNAIQLKGKSGFDSSVNLTYDAKNNSLVVNGNLSANKAEINNSLVCNGAIYGNIKTVSPEYYEVQDTDYTILCDSTKNVVNVIVPPACNYAGRILTIKKINDNKYSLRSRPVKVRVQEGSIDFTDEIELKMNYSSRTIQSDGDNWWVVGHKGT